VTVVAAQVVVGATPTKLNTTVDGDSVFGELITMQNRGAADIFIGGSGVTTATGFKLSSTDPPLKQELKQEDIYGIVATATQPMHVLLTGV
jgi:hypothetical protein